MTSKKRIQLTLSEESFIKCEELANRYGITPNSFMAFVIGQWLDHNYEINKRRGYTGCKICFCGS